MEFVPHLARVIVDFMDGNGGSCDMTGVNAQQCTVDMIVDAVKAVPTYDNSKFIMGFN